MSARLDLNLGEAKALLGRAAEQLTDPTALMQQIGEYAVRSTQERFKAGVSPDGRAWARNSPATLARKRGSRPLFGETGKLSSTIFASASANMVIWGSGREQAAVQQYGARRGAFGAYSGVNKDGRAYSGVTPWGDIPARPFIGISRADETNLSALVEDWLDRALS